MGRWGDKRAKSPGQTSGRTDKQTDKQTEAGQTDTPKTIQHPLLRAVTDLFFLSLFLALYYTSLRLITVA